MVVLVSICSLSGIDQLHLSGLWFHAGKHSWEQKSQSALAKKNKKRSLEPVGYCLATVSRLNHRQTTADVFQQFTGINWVTLHDATVVTGKWQTDCPDFKSLILILFINRNLFFAHFGTWKLCSPQRMCLVNCSSAVEALFHVQFQVIYSTLLLQMGAHQLGLRLSTKHRWRKHRVRLSSPCALAAQSSVRPSSAAWSGDVVVETGLCKDVAAPVSWLLGQPRVLFVSWPFVPSQNAHYLKPSEFSGRLVKVFFTKKKKKNGSSVNAEMISGRVNFK